MYAVWPMDNGQVGVLRGGRGRSCVVDSSIAELGPRADCDCERQYMLHGRFLVREVGERGISCPESGSHGDVMFDRDKLHLCLCMLEYDCGLRSR